MTPITTPTDLKVHSQTLHAPENFPSPHTILNRPRMAFRPYGVTPNGTKIRDVRGIIVRANVDFLEEQLIRGQGKESAKATLRNLCELWNYPLVGSP